MRLDERAPSGISDLCAIDGQPMERARVVQAKSAYRFVTGKAGSLALAPLSRWSFWRQLNWPNLTASDESVKLAARVPVPVRETMDELVSLSASRLFAEHQLYTVGTIRTHLDRENLIACVRLRSQPSSKLISLYCRAFLHYFLVLKP